MVQAMVGPKVKVIATLMLAAGLLAGAAMAGYAALTTESVQDQKPEKEQPKNRRKDADDIEKKKRAALQQMNLERLMKDRLDAVRERMKALAEEVRAGKATLEHLFDSSGLLLQAQLDLSDKPVDQLKALQMHFERMRTVQEVNETRFKANKASTADVALARYMRYDAEIRLARFEAAVGPDGAKGEVTKALFEGTSIKELLPE
jgi:hypothetical protein